MPALRALLAVDRAPLLIVFDDVMNLADALAPSLLETVLAALPPGSQLAMGTRDVTPYPARRLRSSGRTLELGGADLAMDAIEAQALLAELGVEVDEEQLDEILERTEGWPVGLYLLGKALLAESDLLEVEGSPGLTPGWIADYLRDELFGSLPEQTREFLMRVSIIDDLCGPVCDAVVGRPGSLELLRELSAQNHLIRRSDRPDECYRLHHLFSDFLRSELYARSIPEYHEAHRRASQWYASQGEDDLARRPCQGDGRRRGAGAFHLGAHLEAADERPNARCPTLADRTQRAKNRRAAGTRSIELLRQRPRRGDGEDVGDGGSPASPRTGRFLGTRRIGPTTTVAEALLGEKRAQLDRQRYLGGTRDAEGAGGPVGNGGSLPSGGRLPVPR